MWLLCVQLLTRKNSYGLVWAIMISPPELPIYDEALNQWFSNFSARWPPTKVYNFL